MPSSKAPTGIQTGPGRLPSSVVASVQGTSTVVFDEKHTYLRIVAEDVVLTRDAQTMIIHVLPQAELMFITLPAAPLPGDIITVVDITGLAGAHNFSIMGTPFSINGSFVMVNSNRKSVTMSFNGNWFIIGVGP